MSDHPNGVSTREHFEEIIARFERSVTDQISGLREDIKHLQNNYVTRHEHDTVLDSLKREIERLDREIDRSSKSAESDLQEFKSDQREDRRNTLGLAAFVFGGIEFLSRVVIK